MKSQVFFSILAVALLSACGGSSSNDNPTTDNNSTTNNSAANNSQTQNQQSNTVNNGLSIQRADTNLSGIFLSRTNGRPALVNNIEDTNNQTLTFITGDRDPIQLPTYAADKKEGGILIYGSANGIGNTVERDGLSYKTFLVSDNSYRYSQFGNIVTDKEFNGFYRGQRTVDMPTSGSATYAGDIILDFIDTPNNSLSKVEQGTVAANADFGAKTAAFDIKSPSHTEHVDTKIINSDFLGTVDHSERGGRGQVLGTFTGPNAEEMFGSYVAVVNTEKDGTGTAINGYFGAKKQ